MIPFQNLHEFYLFSTRPFEKSSFGHNFPRMIAPNLLIELNESKIIEIVLIYYFFTDSAYLCKGTL